MKFFLIFCDIIFLDFLMVFDFIIEEIEEFIFLDREFIIIIVLEYVREIYFYLREVEVKKMFKIFYLVLK